MAEGFHHISVLLEEVLESLAVPAGGIAVDATLGGAGHAYRIAEQLGPEGLLVGLDQDPQALQRAGAVLADAPCRVELVQANFGELPRVCAELGIQRIDALLADLGVSSHQLDTAERGFSFQHDGPLDMRMDPTRGESASELLTRLDERELADVLFRYGEERASRRIARRIKQTGPRDWRTLELAELVEQVLGRRPGQRIHPATRTFQGLRIAVNGELDALESLLDAIPELLGSRGRAAIIAFHSLEDRPVKRRFRELSRACTCPPEWPLCRCGGQASFRLVQRRAVVAGAEEQDQNPRSRSARLRVLERLEVDERSEPEDRRPGAGRDVT